MYRIRKNEHVQYRVSWLTKTLLGISPTYYNRVASYKEAQDKLFQIFNTLQGNPHRRKDTKVLLTTEDTCQLVSDKNHPYITFAITESKNGIK